MVWKILNEVSQIETLLEDSHTKDILIFKHSTTCSVSMISKLKLEDEWNSEMDIVPYYLDVKGSREISNSIAEILGVHHESPQVILIRDGECIYDESHFDISLADIRESIRFHGVR